MLGNRRLDLGDVLGPAFPGGTRFSERMATLRAMRERMDLGLIIPLRKGSPNAWMALLSSRPLLGGFRRGFFIRGFHPRGRRRVRIGRLSLDRFLEGFDFLIQFQELLDSGVFARTV